MFEALGLERRAKDVVDVRSYLADVASRQPGKPAGGGVDEAAHD
jgi:hypothetical protein